MIRVTGDTHRMIGKFQNRNPNFIHDTTWGEGDVLIVAGDFGFVFLDTPEEHDWLDWLEKTKKYQIAFVDGNHENHPRIAEYPEEIWNGGRVHRIRKNIYHLMRGQVFEIENKRIFTFGGAFSIDRAFKGDLWWEAEIPTASEFEEGRRNLEKYNYEIEYCITHTATSFIVQELGYNPNVNEDRWLLDYLSEDVYRMCKSNLKCWFFGHFHEDRELHGGVFRALLNDVVVLD